MEMKSSGELTTILEGVLVTPEILDKYTASEVRLRVEISEANHDQCRQDLLSLIGGDRPSVSESEVDSCYTTDQSGKTMQFFPHFISFYVS